MAERPGGGGVACGATDPVPVDVGASHGGGGRPPAGEGSLIDALPVDADCQEDDPSAAPTPGAGETVLVEMSVQDGCLRAELTIVPMSEVATLADEARARPDVVAADVATGSAPAPAAPMQITPDPPIEEQKWWLEWLHVGGFDAAAARQRRCRSSASAWSTTGSAPIRTSIHSWRTCLARCPSHRSTTARTSPGSSAPSRTTTGSGGVFAKSVTLVDSPALEGTDPFANGIRRAVANGAGVINMSVVELVGRRARSSLGLIE